VKVYLATKSSICIDDGIVGIFSTYDKAVEFFRAHPEAFIRSGYAGGPDAFIEEVELDPAEAYE
jgi:hypothetical protein